LEAQVMIAAAACCGRNWQYSTPGYFNNTIDLVVERQVLVTRTSSLRFRHQALTSGQSVWWIKPRSRQRSFDDSDGNILIAGYFYGTVDFVGAIEQTKRCRHFLAKYAPTEPTCGQVRRHCVSDNALANSVTVDGNGNVVITGYSKVTRIWGRHHDQCRQL
jgi:hypothetical protein